jgi:hypothetical protein
MKDRRSMTRRRLIKIIFNAEKLIRKTFNPSYYIVNIEHTNAFMTLRQEFWKRSIIQVPDLFFTLSIQIIEEEGLCSY